VPADAAAVFVGKQHFLPKCGIDSAGKEGQLKRRRLNDPELDVRLTLMDLDVNEVSLELS
jgi:hypothetical protein